MLNNPHRFFVVTGGPGSGKTALIDALERAGYSRSIEAGRGVIQDQVAIGGRAVPWQDPLSFAELMLSWEMRSYRLGLEQSGTVFFDRGVPDVVGYLRMLRLPVPEYMHVAALKFRYNARVFITPPWPEIFRSDNERKQTFEEAVRTHEAMLETYTSYNYELMEIPRVPVPKRVQFVVEKTGLA